jgi:hypothetical protein
MQAAIKNGCGRRLESDVWNHFKYDAVSERSTCLVVDDGNPCNKTFSGKNTTNLKNHLQSQHKHAFELCQKHDTKLKNEKRKSGSATGIPLQPISSPSPSTSQGSIPGLLKKPAIWPANSDEALKREKSLADFLIATGHSTRIVDEPVFRNFFRHWIPSFVFQVCSNTKFNEISVFTLEICILPAYQRISSGLRSCHLPGYRQLSYITLYI